MGRTMGDRGGWSASTLALAALGLGCYLGWQTVDISPTLFPAPRAGVAETIAAWGYPYMLLFVGLLVAIVWWSRTHGSLLRDGRPTVVAGIGTCAATAVLYGCGWSADPPVIAGVVTGRLAFFVSGLFVALWGEALCRVRPTLTLSIVAAGYTFSFGICLVVADLGPVGAPALRTLLPLFSAATLLAVRDDRGWGHHVDLAQVESDTAFRLPARLFAGIGILGCVFTVANHLSETKTEISTELYTLLAGVIAALAILAVAVAARRRRTNFSFLYRLVTPLVIGALLLTLMLQPGYQRYEALAIGFAWVFFRIFTWTLWAHVGSEDPERGGAVFAAGQGFLAVGSTVGELASSSVDLGALPLAGSVSAIIFVAVVTSALVMDEGSIMQFFSTKGAPEKSLDPQENRAGNDLANDVAGMDGAGRGDRDAHGRLTGEPALAAGLPPMPHGTPGWLVRFDYDALTERDIARIMQDDGLSERECQICLLVLRGLDDASILDKACITKSTLRTHLRNIYAKTNVHSRRELIDLLERRVAE